MLTPQFILALSAKLVIDLFAGGGGVSTGIEQAIGRHVDVAINHDADAIGMHEINHPQTRHYRTDSRDLKIDDPMEGIENTKPPTRSAWTKWSRCWRACAKTTTCGCGPTSLSPSSRARAPRS